MLFYARDFTFLTRIRFIPECDIREIKNRVYCKREIRVYVFFKKIDIDENNAN